MAGGGGEEGGTVRGREGQDILDGVAVLEDHDGAFGAGSPPIPYSHGLVVAAADEEVGAAGAGHEAAAADVVGVAGEFCGAAVTLGEVPQADGAVVRPGHEGGVIPWAPSGAPDGLAMLAPGAEDGARIGVEDLEGARVAAGADDAGVAAQLGGAGGVGKAEAGDGLDQLAGAGGVEVDAGAGGDGEEVLRDILGGWV